MSDAVTFTEGSHCIGGDPGKSFAAGNTGGDEAGPSPDPITTGPGELNPGGNNDNSPVAP